MRAPRAGRDDHLVFCAHVPAVSIYAPREGCDANNPELLHTVMEFQSTHPARGAT